ncbi:MAG: glutamine synthetase [Candidatus Eisenbacteria bacterium]|nr:glutamine synthetase [Candidatus Eisenbacteria bacterium]
MSWTECPGDPASTNLRPQVGERGHPAGSLRRLIGKPPESWRASDLVELVRDRGIRLVSLMHAGGDGWLKTLDFAPRSLSHLEDVLLGGERADGSSLFAGSGIRAGASDIVLRPRLHRAFLDPFSPLPTLTVLCGHAGRDGGPLPESPDTILRRADRRLREEIGIELHALGEVEYFLGKEPSELDAYGAPDWGYHATAPFVFGEDLRRRAIGLLGEIGVPIKYGHSEVGYIPAKEENDRIWEQHEIELGLAPLPEAAENTVLTQWVLRNLARRSGMICSFDPIVRKGHAGSGFHFHCCPMRGGEVFAGRDETGELREPAKWLIAGLVEAGGALMAFGNRCLGSFVRLTQGKEAPNTVFWGEFNRRALVRLPIVASAEDDRQVGIPTVEFRLPDGSAQPYLILAGIAQAMRYGRDAEDLEGVLARTSVDNADGEGEDGRTPVPRNFLEVAAALESLRGIFEAGGVFPPRMIDQVLATLRP